ncbi:hypothetical protein BOA8489_03616 [Boseongicola aestuarii]|uniref:Uncharacterized protein n=1 Tax=Boseongicola aestuarii TaxID=1470561 RepID=A0A238J536_9RHOB|nr:hypothetical protein BOA8489_03616 [Boseongicola aestuarii]
MGSKQTFAAACNNDCYADKPDLGKRGMVNCGEH